MNALRCCMLLLIAGAAAQAAELSYETRFAWDASTDTRRALEPLAEEAFAAETSPVASARHLLRRANRHRDFLDATLRSLGYYAATVDVDVDGDAAPLRLDVRIVPGPRFALGTIEIVATPGAAPGAPLPTPADIGLATGRPAEADAIVAGGNRALAWLRARAHPFPDLANQRVVVDHATTLVAVTYTIDPGPRAVFGPLQVEGLASVREEVLHKELPWKEGDPYDARLIAELQGRLYRANLFSLLRVGPAEEVGHDGALPILATVTERAHRTIATGLEYRTDHGPGARVNWEHRNRRGLGHRLALGLKASTAEAGIEGSYTVRRFRRPDQKLTVTFDAGREDIDAYESTRLDTTTWVERELGPRLALGVGLGLRVSSVEQGRRRESYQLLSTPVQVRYDASNDPLDPTSGFRAQARLTPYFSISDPGSVFLKSENSVSHYLPLNQARDWVLATRLHFGAIVFERLNGIPPDVRFYAGGGGSVRGYAYQTVSPLNFEDVPIGGRSVLEGAVELRYRITESIGMALFMEAGNAFDSPFPDFDGGLQYAAGLGLRYFTPLGPFRFDVALPLNKRKIDSSFQIYLSIGQAF